MAHQQPQYAERTFRNIQYIKENAVIFMSFRMQSQKVREGEHLSVYYVYITQAHDETEHNKSKGRRTNIPIKILVTRTEMAKRSALFKILTKKMANKYIQ